ncbi:MAG: hypothetical protein Q7S22_03845 [Candidatus Micrarchaeota archaeon]|nr:hypothetical protein [Candidatus Micrarchaeota archaeon]
MEKSILCDSSALISLTEASLEDAFYFLKEKFNIKFIIPPSVEYETILRPLEGMFKSHSFSAMRLKRAMNDGAIIKIESNGSVKRTTNEVLRLTNNLFFMKGNPLRLVQMGEAEMVALAKELDVNHILIDERTTRMLIESPFRMKEHLEKEFGVSIMVNRENLAKFSELTKGMEPMRSSELLVIAYENGFLDKFNEFKKQAFEAAMYKIKFSGCAIRFDEIAEVVKAER